MSNTANVTLRLPTDLLERIDEAAARRGQNRTEYMTQWLPVYHDEPDAKDKRGHRIGARATRYSTAQTTPTKAPRQRRASSAGSDSSPSRVDTDA